MGQQKPGRGDRSYSGSGERPRCTCGKRGCLESLASGSSLTRLAREGIEAMGKERRKKILALSGGHIEGVTAKTLFLAARQRDPFSLRLFQDAGRCVGSAIAQTVVLLDLERVVVGGGVANAGRLFFDPIREVFKRLLPEPLASVRW